MSELFLGLMSGTSVDGIDAALVRFAPDIHLVIARTYDWPPDLRAQLIALGQGGNTPSLDVLGELNTQIGRAFAEAANALLQEAEMASATVTAIGSHGQTVRHRPLARHPFTLQIGDANVLAEHCGITTVADFRSRDVAAGGHGAPLMPAFHAAALQSPDENRAVLNLGGIGNFTLLPSQGDVRGFDTGPANALMDAWCECHTDKPFDALGALASSGNVHHALLQQLIADPWFALPPPKSTGREQFHLDWVKAGLEGFDVSVADVQATLLELSAVTVANALLMTQPSTHRVLVCGGGVRNPLLLDRIAAHLPGMVIESTAIHGLDPDYVEAMGFAWLARETLAGRPGNLPSVTGAAGPRVLGAIYPV